MPRNLLKVISAFLFAVVAVVGIHFGLWILAADLAQDKLFSGINNTKGFRIEAGHVRKFGYPSKIVLDLRDVTIHWNDKDSQQKVTLKTGDMMLETDFLAQKRIEISFGKDQKIRYENGQKTSDYNLLIDGGELSLFQQTDLHEINLKFRSMTLLDGATEEPTLKMADTYLSRESSGSQSSQWIGRFSSNKISFATPEGMDTLEALSADGTVSAFPPQMVSTLVSWAFVPENRSEVGLSMLHRLSESKSFFEINDIRVEQDNFWVSLRGQLQLDERMRPEGFVSLTTNMPDPLMHYLRTKEMINDVALAQNKYVLKLLSANRENVSLRFECSDGNLSLQGAPVGVVPPLSTWIDRG